MSVALRELAEEPEAPKLDGVQRAALRERVRRERAARLRDSVPLMEAVERSLAETVCGCDEPQDYLSRPLESSHRCPNPKPRSTST
jgi:hypothetical protein